MTQIQRILDKAKAIVIPGIYDTLSAKIAEQVGFPMGFVSGYSVAATMIGEPDLGLLTQTEMIERARHICASVSIPVIIDADTGYGNPLNVYRTIKELIAAGVRRVAFWKTKFGRRGAATCAAKRSLSASNTWKRFTPLLRPLFIDRT